MEVIDTVVVQARYSNADEDRNWQKQSIIKGLSSLLMTKGREQVIAPFLLSHTPVY